MGIELSPHVKFYGIYIGADHVSENDLLVFSKDSWLWRSEMKKKEKQKEAVQAEKMQCFLSPSPPAFFFPVLSTRVILTFCKKSLKKALLESFIALDRFSVNELRCYNHPSCWGEK